MSRAFVVAALALGFGPAFAQSEPAAPAPPAPAPPPTDTDAFEARLRRRSSRRRAKEVKELREEMRAQLATQSIAQGWQEEWVEEKRKLELLTFDGYLRVRPDLFYKFDLGRGPDPAGYSLWPRSPISARRTAAHPDRREHALPLRAHPEHLRRGAGAGAGRRAGQHGVGLARPTTPTRATPSTATSTTPTPTRSSPTARCRRAPGINSLNDSVRVKRLYGEVSTPVGILRFGRMGSHWGLGMLHNDGTGIDSDFGDTVDRFMFVAEPVSGWYVTPMLDFNVCGPTSARQTLGGQPFDLSQSDNAMSFILAIARRDTDSEARAKLDSGQSVLQLRPALRLARRRGPTRSTCSRSPSPPTARTRARRPASTCCATRTSSCRTCGASSSGRPSASRPRAAAVMGWMDNRSLSATDASVPGSQRLAFWQFGARAAGRVQVPQRRPRGGRRGRLRLR